MSQVQPTGTWRIVVVRSDGVHQPLEKFPQNGKPQGQRDFPTKDAALKWGLENITNPEIDWKIVQV